MERKTFYNDRRKERAIDFLADYRVVRRYFCRKHDLNQGDFEFLVKLHSLGTFLRQDFKNNVHTLAWDHKRWDRMYGEWVVVYRERKPSEGRKYRIYTISNKAKTMVEDCYRILCGEKAIPEVKQFNPIMAEESYEDKRYAKAIKAFNAARQETQ